MDIPERRPAVPKLRPFRPVPKHVGLAPRPSSATAPHQPSAPPPSAIKPSKAKPKPPSGPPPASVLSQRSPEKKAEKTETSTAKSEPTKDAWSLLNPVEADSPAESENYAAFEVQEPSDDAVHEPASSSKVGGDVWDLLGQPGDIEDDEMVYEAEEDELDDSRSQEAQRDSNEDQNGDLHETYPEKARPSSSENPRFARRNEAGDMDNSDSDDDNSWGAWGKKSEVDENGNIASGDEESWGEWSRSHNGHQGDSSRGGSQDDGNADGAFKIEGVASDSENDSDEAWGDWGASGSTIKAGTDTSDKSDEAWGEWKATGAGSQKRSRGDDRYESGNWSGKEERNDWDGGGWKNDSELPIRQKIHEVVPLLCGKERVCCVLGETGCGKSTQVPQILLEQAEKAGQSARIAVSQPRRVAALNLARRVAKEMGEGDVGNSVGYRIGGENMTGKKIDFCTVGYMLQLLMHRPKEFEKYTHVVLDEVHERSAESDMLCLVVKLLARPSHCRTRIIIMSATLQSDLFVEYYKPLCWGDVPARLHIKARCFPVQEFYLEDLKARFGRRFRNAQAVDARIRDHFPAEGSKKVDQRHTEKYHQIILDLLPLIAERGSTILVFLPGISEISSLWEEGRNLEDRNLQFFPLHSMIPREEQELVFQEPSQSVTHVVLATDIAESSITLPHVVAVIDLGLHRRVDHDDKKGMATLATKWISRAAAKQRSGRAGRTQPGICLRLYTRQFHDSVMAEFEPPESASMTLDRLYLQAKQMSEQLKQSLWDSAPKGAQAVLEEMVQPPSLQNIVAARVVNAALGTITLPTEESKITTLGRVCLALPLELRLARLVWLGAMMGAVSDAVVLASVLSSLDPFSSPTMLFMRQEDRFMDSLRSSTSARLLFDGGHLSEPIMLRQLFLEWLVKFHSQTYVWGTKEKVTRARRKHTADFSTVFSLSRGRMEHVISHALDLSLRTLRCCDWRSRAYEQLKTFILGLGYTVNDRGDLAGIAWEDWKPYKAAFQTDVGYLKGLLAAAFSDNLLLGSYGGLPAIEAKGNARSEQLSQQTALLRAMQEKNMRARQTAVYIDMKDALLDDCIEAVLAGRKKQEKVKVGGAGMVLVDFGTPDASRWHDLDSRPGGNLLDAPHMLVAEFNLLSNFEKNIRDMVNAKISTKWNGRVPPIQHPCQLRWELMQQVVNQRGSQVRCEAVCEKRNALGCVGYVQELKPKEDMKRFVVLGVASSLRGGENPSRTYPSGVTALDPGHIAFVLATAQIETGMWGLQRFGFTLQGALAILHRSVELPKGIVDRTQWQLVLELRESLRNELKVTDEWWSDTDNQSTPLMSDSPAEEKARALWKSVKHVSSRPSYHMAEDRRDPTPQELVGSTVPLFAQSTKEKPIEQSCAFWPLVPWKDLEKRRDGVLQRLKDTASKATNEKGVKEAAQAAFQAQKEKLAAQKRAAAGIPGQPATKQPKVIEPPATASSNCPFAGRWIEVMTKAGSLAPGTKCKIQYQFTQGKFGLSWLRLSNGDHIGTSLEGKIWKFCDPPAGEAETKAGTPAPTHPQAQPPTQTQAQAQAPAGTQPRAQVQHQAQPQAQTQSPNHTKSQGPFTNAWNQKTAGVTFNPDAPVNTLTSLDLFLQIVSLKMVIWTVDEKNYVACLMDSAFRKQGFFAPAEHAQASNCVNQVRLVNPTANLGGMVWPPGFPMPLGITQAQMGFRARFHALIGELCRRSPLTSAWSGNTAAGYAPPRPAFSFPTAGVPPPGSMPQHGGFPPAQGYIPPSAGQTSASATAPNTSASNPAAAFLPPREELLKLSASQLKEMIKQVGLTTAGCFEKGDLVDRLVSGHGDAVAKVAADVRGSDYTPGNSSSATTDTPVDTSTCAPKTPTEDEPPKTENSTETTPSDSAKGSQTSTGKTNDESQLSEGAKAAAALLLRRRAKKARTTATATEEANPPAHQPTAKEE